MDTIYKTFRAECKGTDEDGTLDMFIPVSINTIDRDGELIEPTAFKKTLPKFMKHPVLVSSHDYRDLTKQIGEWIKLKTVDNGIEGKPKYYKDEGNEEADWAYNLASKGRAAFSIGFIPKVWEDGDGEKAPRRTYKEVELLEISQVIIPSNREAIQSIRSKSVDPVVCELCDVVESELGEGTVMGEGTTLKDAVNLGEGITPNIDSQKVAETVTEPQQPQTDIELEEKQETVDREAEAIVTKPEETDDYIRIPVKECKVTATIDISEKEGIKALYCGKEKQVATYLFAKDHGWTMEKAKQWVKDHAKAIILIDAQDVEQKEISDVEKDDPPQEKSVSQKQILDEIDYLKTLLEENGLSDNAEEALRVFIDSLNLLPADGLATKFGAVLNKKNKERLNQIKVLAQEVLDSTGDLEDEKGFPVDHTTVDEKDIAEEILREIGKIKL